MLQQDHDGKRPEGILGDNSSSPVESLRVPGSRVMSVGLMLLALGGCAEDGKQDPRTGGEPAAATGEEVPGQAPAPRPLAWAVSQKDVTPVIELPPVEPVRKAEPAPRLAEVQEPAVRTWAEAYVHERWFALPTAEQSVLALGEKAVPDLTKLLEYPSFRPRVTGLFEAMGPAAVSAAATLLAITGDEELEAKAVAAVGHMGPDALPAVLNGIARSGDPGEEARSAAALRTIIEAHPDATDPKDVIPILLALNQRGMMYGKTKEGHDVRDEAIGALSALGPRAIETLPVLIEALSDEGPYTVEFDGEVEQFPSGIPLSAALAICNMGPAAKEALPHLAAFLPRAVGSGLEISRGLEKMLPASAELVPELASAINRCQDPSECEVYAQALAAVGGSRPKETITALMVVVERFRKEDSLCAHTAVTALGRMGRQAAEARPLLLTICREQQGDKLWLAARIAAAKIGE